MGSWFKNTFKKIAFKKEILPGDDDPLVWYRDLEKYAYGKYSYAAVRSNGEVEDYSEIIPGPDATFVGIYDGHNGHEASEYISKNLSKTLLRRVKNHQSTLTEEIEGAISDTENGFMDTIPGSHPLIKNLSIVGSCCLVGVMNKRTLILANLGDSKAVLGWYDSSILSIRATHLTYDHGVESDNHRRNLNMQSNNRGRGYLVRRNGIWLVMGLLKTTHAIGDGFLKEARFNVAPLTSPFHIHNPLRYPMISAVPAIHTRNIGKNDRFLIFASRGFWEHFTDEEVVELVKKKPKAGIARRLIVCAMERAAQKKNTTYNAVKQIPAGEERTAIHEDMTIIVLFINHNKFNKKPREDLCTVQAFAGRRGLARFKF